MASGKRQITVTFIRHAETVANRDNILQGHCDYPLTEEGRSYAEKVAPFIAQELWTLAYASDLPRAYTTASILLGDNPRLTITDTALLREVSYGIRERLPRGTTVQQAKEIIAARDNVTVDSITDDFAETSEQVISRQTKFLDQVFSDLDALKLFDEGQKPIHIVVVSHGGFIKLFFQTFCEYLNFNDKIKNCATSTAIVECINQDGPAAGRYNVSAERSGINVVVV